MKKKIIVLIAVLLCAVTVLCSCGGAMKFNKVFDKKAEFVGPDPVLTNVTALDIKGEPEDIAGDLVLFVGADDNDNAIYTIYDLAAGAVVWTATDSETVRHMPLMPFMNPMMDLEDMELPEGVFIVAKTTKGATEEDDDVNEISMYDKKGTCFWSVSGTDEEMDDRDLEEPYFAVDMIGIDGQMFRVAEDGTVSKAFDYSPFRSLPEVNAKAAGYYYELDYNYGEYRMASGPMMGQVSYVNVYDAELNLVTRVEAPAYAMDGGMMVHVLNNGNLLVQYSVYEAEDAEDYTVLDEEGNKVTVVTYYANVKKGTFKELDTEYLYMTVLTRDSSDSIFGEDDIDLWEMIGLNDKIENIAIAFPIENQRLSLNMYGGMLDSAVGVALSNKGKVEGTLNGAIENQSLMAMRLSANRWMIENKAGQSFMVDEKGKVVADITNLWDASDGGGLDYFLYNDKIYDMDLNVKLDLKTLKIDDVLFCTDYGVVFEDEDGAVIMAMADGSTKTLIAKDADQLLYDFNEPYEDYYDYNGFFVIVDVSDESNTKATVYNGRGEAIHTVEKAVSAYVVYAADSNNNVLVGVTVLDEESGSKTVYMVVKAG